MSAPTKLGPQLRLDGAFLLAGWIGVAVVHLIVHPPNLRGSYGMSSMDVIPLAVLLGGAYWMGLRIEPIWLMWLYGVVGSLPMVADTFPSDFVLVHQPVSNPLITGVALALGIASACRVLATLRRG